METPTEIQSVLEHWRVTKVPLNPGGTSEQISAVEKALGLTMPGPLRMLYREANGMRDSDSQHFYLWPLEEVLTESKSWDVPTVMPIILFGDFLIASHAYGVVCEGPETGSVYVFGGNPIKVADSINAFFAYIVNEPERVQLWRG